MKQHMRTSLWVLAALILSGVAAAQHHPSQKHLKRSFCLQQCAAEIAATCKKPHFHQCRGTLIRACQHKKPGFCTTSTTTTTTAAPSSTTSTTTPSRAGTVKGALAPTAGRFNFNAMLGLPGANAACNTNFAGTHACSYQELQSAAAAGDLKGLKDLTAMSFWRSTPWWIPSSSATTRSSLISTGNTRRRTRGPGVRRSISTTPPAPSGRSRRVCSAISPATPG